MKQSPAVYRRMDSEVDLKTDFRVIREDYSRNEFLRIQQKKHVGFSLPSLESVNMTLPKLYREITNRLSIVKLSLPTSHSITRLLVVLVLGKQ